MKKFFFSFVAAVIVVLALYFFGFVKSPFFAQRQADVHEVAMTKVHHHGLNLVGNVVHHVHEVHTVSVVDHPVHLL